MTAVPTAMTALLDLLHADSEMTTDGVLVQDGPWVQRPENTQDLVCIGWIPDEGETVTWAARPADLGGASSAEDFTFQGLVDSLNGDGDMAVARVRADALLERIRVIIQRNKRLNGAVNTCELSTLGASPIQNDDGAEWAIRFGITCRVF